VQGLLTLRWRAWMTEDLLDQYMSDQTFYNIHAGSVVDNPDQRLTSDISAFTASSLSLAFTFLTSLVDLVSFSGILFSIYPPLFIALGVYAVGGTIVSFYIGRVRFAACNLLSARLRNRAWAEKPLPNFPRQNCAAA
jgi:ABC-type uncharacterized transport system fused permease/ATPase subunit